MRAPPADSRWTGTRDCCVRSLLQARSEPAAMPARCRKPDERAALLNRLPPREPCRSGVGTTRPLARLQIKRARGVEYLHR